MIVTVHNCSGSEIVVRYLPKPPNKGGRLLLGVGESTQIHDAYVPMDLYAAYVSNEDKSYARLTIDQSTSDVHFSATGAGFGRGIMPPPPSSQQQQPPQQQQRVQFTTDVTPLEKMEGVMLPGADTGPGSFSSGGVGGAELAPGEMEAEKPVYVEGLGYIMLSGVKPEMQAKIRERLAMGEQQQQQQEQQQQQLVPRYSLPPGVRPGEAMELVVRAEPSFFHTSLTLPALAIFLVVVAFVYFAVQSKRRQKRRF
jgi:hypothetical protein